MKAQTKFDQHLKSLGIPIDGISGTGRDCRIDFQKEATIEQIEQGNAERAAFDWSDDPPPPEYAVKRESAYGQRSVGTQLDAIYHFAKDLAAYIQKGGITPDASAPIGTPEEWLAWQDKVRQDIPKP